MPGNSRLPRDVRFWRRVEKTDTCWLWTGALTPGGYGKFSDSPRSGWVGAHVESWVMAHGARPEPPLVIRHRCDVRRCVRPEHLEAGTRAENQGDMKTRDRVRFGEGHHNAKLTEEAVREIRNEHASGVSMADLARRHSVSFMTVSRVVRGESWARVVSGCRTKL